ncbi:nucleic-acid-binding protein from transposon X-element [Trichonephila clavipes]|uniref:Nucleic-acid-binding protein from transposon X-element n=1 Tax=Trichonephila clavipes TaxID=2585209 RepID=A0A8X6W4H8_TRICX|nr:nucleic-acid-binding protein from transposon X-element [Trichonephila clavipes]
MALDNQTGMDFTPQSPLSTASNGTAPTPCEELTSMKIYLRRLQIICNEKERTVSLLRQDKGHDESDTLYQLAWNEYQDVQSSLQQAVSDFDSLPPVPIQAARIMSHLKSPLKILLHLLPLGEIFSKNVKMMMTLNFPQSEKLHAKLSCRIPKRLELKTNFPFSPMSLLNKSQVDTIKKVLTLKTTGEYIKLYSNTTEQNRIVRQTLIQLGYRFYVITPKNERPIKVVIKGFPKKANPEDIKKDLEKEGFEPERVTQLVGRRTKQLLPIFQVTLPRTIENLKIFDLKTLAHLNITVDGYNGRGVTQCFSCNNFHHNADNCYLKPRCLKCGEEHLTKDCPIKQRLETKFCINCQVYGHMANWYGCHCFPKPPKGTAKINRNSYTNLYNSLIRPNLSYAQATSGKPAITNKNPQQMAPRKPETSRQTETVVQTPPIINRNVNPQTSTTQAINQNQNVPITNTTNNNSDIKTLLSTTVQCLIQLLNAMNTTPAIANNFDTVNSAQADANQMYSLLEASCNAVNNQ